MDHLFKITREVLSYAESFITRHTDSEQHQRLLLTALKGLHQSIKDEKFPPPFIHIPLLVYAGIRGDGRPAIPLAGASAMLFTGIDIMDDLADGDLPDCWQGYSHSEISLASSTLLCSLPQLAIAELDADQSVIASMQGTIAGGLLKMAEGQQADIAFRCSQNPNPEVIEASVAGKSGAELAMFASLAAQFAGAGQELVNTYSEFGKSMGAAGQIASDCHDIFQSSESRDLTNGTRTLPVALYLKSLNHEEQAAFLDLLKTAMHDREAQNIVRRRLMTSGVLRHCAFIVELYIMRALKELERASPLEPAYTGLRAMAGMITFFPKKEAVYEP